MEKIKSAPKDGTVVDLWSAEGRTVNAEYGIPTSGAFCIWTKPCWCITVASAIDDIFDERLEAAFLNGYEETDEYPEDDPTHWMLPPSPP